MYIIAKYLRKIILRLPLLVVFDFGRLIGILFYINTKKRRVAFRNLKLAFPEKSGKEINLILKKSFINFGLNIIGILIGPRIYENVVIKGEENIGDDGGVFVSIHAGNWELAISQFSRNHNFAILVDKQKNKGLDKFLNEIRAEADTKVCFSLKELITCFKKDYLVGVVVDHGAEDNALVADFFSQKIPTPKGAVYLAKKFNKKIYPGFFIRKRIFSCELHVGSPIEVSGKEDIEILSFLNKIYEDYLRKYPCEYYWYYKRFKRRVSRNVLILSDSKLGHLKQSKALLSFLLEEDYEFRSEIVEVKYKDKFRRILANVLALFAGRNCLVYGKILPFLVDKETWNKLDRIWADIVISTGSFIAPANKLFSSYLGAKSATILRPNMPLSKFDLAIIPEHDRVSSEDTVIIKGALVYRNNVEDKVRECKDFFKLSENKKICLFLGGPGFDTKEFINNLRDFIYKLKDFSLNKGYKLLVSTSRRTPKEVELFLKKELNDFENNEVLVIVNEGNHDFVFEGFIGLSDMVFVSSESISMVSEIGVFNKPCFCVSLESEDEKRKIFLESVGDSFVFIKSPYEIEEIKCQGDGIFEQNRKLVKKAIKKILEV